jgi:hypothetical protein
MKVTINTGNPTLERSYLNFDLTAESTENLIPNKSLKISESILFCKLIFIPHRAFYKEIIVLYFF